MRKEIAGICLVLLVVVTLASLLSYHSLDPSINHVTAGTRPVSNLFGLFGSHLAGFFIGLFGLGAFWVPILLIMASISLFQNKEKEKSPLPLLGAVILIVGTGALFSFHKDYYEALGTTISAGGLIGSPVRKFLQEYMNPWGGTVVLCFVLAIGFVLTTGCSIFKTVVWLWNFLISKMKCCKGVKKQFLAFRKAVNKRLEDRRKRQKVSAQQTAGNVNLPKVKSKPAKSKALIVTPPQVKPISTQPENVKPVKIKTNLPVTKKPVPRQDEFDFMVDKEGFQLPSVDILKDLEASEFSIDHEALKANADLLTGKLKDFGISGSVVEISPGPVITTFEYRPAPGVKISKIVNLSDDLALALSAVSIRIVAPIPGKDVVGIEIPNANREMVAFKDIVVSESYRNLKSHMAICLGKDIVGRPVAVEMDKMPHLLIAGATGAGKSVGLNVMIASLLYKSTPDQVKMIMIDPKRIELSVYEGIPHLITPVVTDMKKATNALFWAVKEMERRYECLATHKVRNITQYNKKVGPDKELMDESGKPLKKMPYIVIIIDEFADLMMVASKDVEVALTRLAQMARASGIHIVLATQRPSVDVITGIIKANFPTRLSFQVSSRTDSRTIIDSNGAENLLGNGDMLYLPPGTAKLMRIHGAFISDDELNDLIAYLKTQQQPDYVEEILDTPPEEKAALKEEDYDARYDEALAFVVQSGQASISSVQRHLRIGYNRAARIIDVMEREGVVGPSDGVKSREVLAKSYEEMN